MTTPTERPDEHPHGGDLEESMKRSTEQQPETFRDESTDDKKVEIGPDPTRAPIRGIDAPERPGGGR